MQNNEFIELWHPLSVSDFLSEAVAVLKRPQVSILDVADAVLYLTSLRAPDSSSLSSVASLLREMSASNHSICRIVLSYIDRFPDPIPFIGIMPAVCPVANSSFIDDILQQFKKLVLSDARLYIPVIGALIDLPLTKQQSSELVLLAEMAMTVVDEADIAVLFRTLFKSIDATMMKSLAVKLRYEVCFVVLLHD